MAMAAKTTCTFQLEETRRPTQRMMLLGKLRVPVVFQIMGFIIVTRVECWSIGSSDSHTVAGGRWQSWYAWQNWRVLMIIDGWLGLEAMEDF